MSIVTESAEEQARQMRAAVQKRQTSQTTTGESSVTRLKTPETSEQSSTPPPSSESVYDRFDAILSEAAELHRRKSKDYGTGDDPYANLRGSEEFGMAAWLGTCMRANDKIRRIKSFAQNGRLENESIEDALIDNVVYFAAALLLYREHNANDG